MHCECFTATCRPPTTLSRPRLPHLRQSAAPWVCRSSILPSQQLQQALDIQHAPQPQQQLPHSPQTRSTTTSSSSTTSITTATGFTTSRRDVAVVLPTLGSLLIGLSSLQLAQPAPAAASKLGAAADSAWEAMGGGPADLTFPESWLGVWGKVTDRQFRLGIVRRTPLGPAAASTATYASLIKLIGTALFSNH